MSDEIIKQLRQDVLSIATSKGRVPGSDGHDSSREYLVQRMTELDLEFYSGDSLELEYEVEGRQFCNLVGGLPGSSSKLAPIILAAHYDAVPGSPGADDNASSVAILLSAIEPLHSAKLNRSILFAFFDAEEPPNYLTPSMGSIYFYNNQMQQAVHCAIVLDLVGHNVPVPTLENVLFITGMESAPFLQDVVKACEDISGIKTIPTLNSYIGDMSDHHIFRINDVPYLFLSSGRWSNYHQPSDTIEGVNFEKTACVAALLVRLVEKISQCEYDGNNNIYDSTETELYFLRKHLSTLQTMLGFTLNSRSDIDNIVKLFTGRFGL